MVTKVLAPKVWGARVNRQAQMRTHLSIYKVILCGGNSITSSEQL